MEKLTDVLILGNKLSDGKTVYHSLPTNVVAIAVAYNEKKSDQLIMFDGKAQYIRNKDLEVIEL
jgi:hypothetical protein